jgi:hypothetical protein
LQSAKSKSDRWFALEVAEAAFNRQLERGGGGPVGDFYFPLFDQPRLFFIEHLEEQAGGNGTSEEPSLGMDFLIAGGEIVGLGLRFDAFHDDPQLERLGHGEDLRQDGDGDSVSADRFGEGLVDFDRVYRKVVEIGEARVAGAKIVDGHVVALLAEAKNRISRHLLPRCIALSNFDAEIAGRDLCIVESPLDHGKELAIRKVRRGDIHVDAKC